MTVRNKKHINNKRKVLQFVAALIMCCCLILLTGINFIAYGNAKQTCMVEQSAETNEPGGNVPEKPVEEKSSAGSISIQEEYVHELHLQQGFAAAENSLKYCLLDEAKLSVVHVELISPPPDL